MSRPALSSSHRRFRCWTAAAALVWAAACPGQTNLSEDSNFDVESLSLEDLLQVHVTSVSRKEESLFGAPAAIFVIGPEEIRNLAADDLVTALRLAPGVQVGRISSNLVALSPRGFNDVSANKLLALIDGRSIYSPLFGGVTWSDHDMVMADVERIEVIRGPGATLWGANAVNGVVNITTKSAHETLGTLLQANLRDDGSYAASIRQGFALDERTDARVFVRSVSEEPFDAPTGAATHGPITSTLVGFRADRRTRHDGTFTVSGQWSQSREHVDQARYSLTPPYQQFVSVRDAAESGHLLASYHVNTGAATEFTWQSYVEHGTSDRVILTNRHLILDTEATVRHRFGSRHDVVAGAGVRRISDTTRGLEQYVFPQPESTQTLFNLFAQDEIQLVPDHLAATVGTKIERNDLTGWELQPGLRVAWRQDQTWTLWASVARAVRTPARAERDTMLFPQVIPPNAQNPLPTQVELLASPDFGSEELLASELGLRAQLTPSLSIDLAAYHNEYDGLRSVEPLGTTVVFTPVPHVVYASISGNGLKGRTQGAEAVINWQPARHWRLQGSWATLHYDLALAPGSMDSMSLTTTPGTSPRHEFKLLSAFDLSETWSIDAFFWHQTALTAIAIPAYTGLNVRLAWKPTHNWEFELAGQDLLKASHPEFPPTYLGGPTQAVPRTVRLAVTWRH